MTTTMKEDRHLTPEEVAQAAELINSNKDFELDARVKDHIKECDQCASEILMTSQISFNRELSISLNKPVRKPGIFRQMHIIAISAAAAAALLWGIFYVLQPDTLDINPVDIVVTEQSADSSAGSFIAEDSPRDIKPEPNQEAIHPSQDIPETEKTKPSNDLPRPSDKPDDQELTILLASYDTHSDLEKLYNNYRGTYRSSGITVRSDSIVKTKESNQLEWNNPDQELLNIEIFNNRNEIIHTFSTQDNHQELPQLEPGLYYWKLINQDFDLLFVGKLIVD